MTGHERGGFTLDRFGQVPDLLRDRGDAELGASGILRGGDRAAQR